MIYMYQNIHFLIFTSRTCPAGLDYFNKRQKVYDVARVFFYTAKMTLLGGGAGKLGHTKAIILTFVELSELCHHHLARW